MCQITLISGRPAKPITFNYVFTFLILPSAGSSWGAAQCPHYRNLSGVKYKISKSPFKFNDPEGIICHWKNHIPDITNIRVCMSNAMIDNCDNTWFEADSSWNCHFLMEDNFCRLAMLRKHRVYRPMISFPYTLQKWHFLTNHCVYRF